MAFTSSSDINILQASDSALVGAGAGDDMYIITPGTLQPGQTITLSDTQGDNVIKFIGGVTVASSKVLYNVLQLTLDNGAVINVLGADTFTFNVGGSSLAIGGDGDVKDFSTFASEDLGVTVPGPEVTTPVEGGEAVPGQGPSNQDPEAVNDTDKFSVNQGESVTISVSDLLANDSDPDGDALSILSVSAADGGTAVLSMDKTTITFTAAVDAEPGNASFTYTITDGSATSTASVTGSITEPFTTVVIQEGTTSPVAATDAAEIFTFDAVSALAMSQDTQIDITGFDSAHDSLRLDIATAGGVDTLDDLNGVDGIAVQVNGITGNTLINFGNDADGDVVTLQLAGILDPSQVQIEAV